MHIVDAAARVFLARCSANEYASRSVAKRPKIGPRLSKLLQAACPFIDLRRRPPRALTVSQGTRPKAPKLGSFELQKGLDGHLLRGQPPVFCLGSETSAAYDDVTLASAARTQVLPISDTLERVWSFGLLQVSS